MAFTGYKVVRAEDLGSLERRVLELADDNYVPYGPVQERDGTFLQTMIIGDVGGSATPANVAAADVDVAAGTDGLDAGSVQEALQDLATRVAALEGA